ncbi:polyisoprenoid-binding protein [Egibacter rhizosphaerae]|uniref:Polyisoprenoid-binding protein n=1 Tax=Egibacter rhizosphaerae TaxID=1670831 RepID=A0A411YGQ5_9ACTN|nr:YceI family protein [Egibacter rhizosphaerae]QBI20346.1 polyisoprenoid-binding protein [Egibacter rhizosphaerae]
MSTATITDHERLTGTYSIDPDHSRIGFVARHAMVSKVRGTFNEFEGTVYADGSNPENSRAELTIQAASIDTANEQRDGHLRSNDFFAMDQYPEITFVSTSVEQVGDLQYKVHGDLTVRGVTQPVTVDVEQNGGVVDPWGYLRVGFEGTTKVDRKDFGLTWNASLDAGGVLVGDEVTIEVEIAAVKGE